MPHGHDLFVNPSYACPESPLHIKDTNEGVAFFEWDFLALRDLPPTNPCAYRALAKCTTASLNDGWSDFLVDFLPPFLDLRTPDFFALDFLAPDRLAPDFLALDFDALFLTPFPFFPPNNDWPLSDTPSIYCASCLTSSLTA